jgi:hypothetical protein
LAQTGGKFLQIVIAGGEKFAAGGTHLRHDFVSPALFIALGI